MKIKHLFGLAVIAAMTASCSSNEDLGTAGPGTGTNEAGVGYATFSPSTCLLQTALVQTVILLMLKVLLMSMM